MKNNFIITSDKDIVIEEQRDGYWRYQQMPTGRRWEVYGVCDKRGNCLVGAVIDGVEVTSLDHAHTLATEYTGLDSPVMPEFSGCCDFTFVELEGIK